MVGSLFSSDAWNNVTFTAGEVRNPRRNLPLSLALGVAIVSALYIACNFVYLNVLTLRRRSRHAPEDRVATAAAAGDVRAGGGADHGRRHHDLDLRLRQRPDPVRRARLLRHGAGQAVLPPRGRTLDPEARTRRYFALAIQCVWAVLLTLSGQYSDLLDYVIFAVLLFYILTIGGLFVLRRTRPDMERPYRALGYPVLPAAVYCWWQA